MFQSREQKIISQGNGNKIYDILLLMLFVCAREQHKKNTMLKMK